MLLKRGSRGNEVKRIQEKLNLTADGIFGPLTETKVKEWQSKNGLTSDGIVGRVTWSKMFQPVPEKLNIDKLKGHIPDNVLSQIPETAKKFHITTNLRLVHFISQCSHESGNFKFVVEIASGAAYEGRKDLGNTQPGDGPRFKGRGYIQLTGRANYAQFSKFCGEDCVKNPDLVATKYPMLSAAYFFDVNNLWIICDKGSTKEVITELTREINGGLNGLQDRINKFNHFNKILRG